MEYYACSHSHIPFIPTHLMCIEPEIFYVPVLRTVDNSIPPKLGSPCAMHELDQEISLVDETGMPIMGHALAGPMPPSKVSRPSSQ